MEGGRRRRWLFGVRKRARPSAQTLLLRLHLTIHEFGPQGRGLEGSERGEEGETRSWEAREGGGLREEDELRIENNKTSTRSTPLFDALDSQFRSIFPSW